MSETMRPWLPLVLCVAIVACERDGDAVVIRDSLSVLPADSPAAATSDRDRPSGGDSASRPADSASRAALGKEPGTIPATPTPTVTSESAIAAMRSSLQRLESADAQQLQSAVAAHQKMLGDLLTTMRVEVQGTTSPAKDSWLAAADTVEGDLDKLAIAQGDSLRNAFRIHRTRVVRLLDRFRVLVPPK